MNLVVFSYNSNWWELWPISGLWLCRKWFWFWGVYCGLTQTLWVTLLTIIGYLSFSLYCRLMWLIFDRAEEPQRFLGHQLKRPFCNGGSMYLCYFILLLIISLLFLRSRFNYWYVSGSLEWILMLSDQIVQSSMFFHSTRRKKEAALH